MKNTMNLVYEQQWTTYEEWGGIRIFEDDQGEFFYQCGGSSVFDPRDLEDPWEELEKISAEEALSFIDEWEVIAAENEEYWG